MPRTRRVLTAVGLALLATVFLKLLSPFSSNAPASSEALFASSFVDAKGAPQTIAQWRGKVLVVNFWASWCPPCMDEMPSLNTFHQQYAAKGAQLVGISAEDIDTLKQFKPQASIGYPLLAGDAQAMPLAQSLGNNRSILPFTAVIDKSGRIATILFGKVEIPVLEKAVTPLL